MRNYDKFIEVWKQRANASKIDVMDVYVRCLVNAVHKVGNGDPMRVLSREIGRAFTPVTNEVKLENGRAPYGALNKIVGTVFMGLDHWDEIIEDDDFIAIDKLDSALEKYLLNQAEKAWDLPHNPYFSYIFIRQDISPEQQLVQAAHVGQQLGMALQQDCPGDYEDLHFCVIGLPTGKDLDIVFAKHTRIPGDLEVVDFYDPDLTNDNWPTGIATFPVKGPGRRPFKKFKPLKFDRLAVPVPKIVDEVSYPSYKGFSFNVPIESEDLPGYVMIEGYGLQPTKHQGILTDDPRLVRYTTA